LDYRIGVRRTVVEQAWVGIVTIRTAIAALTITIVVFVDTTYGVIAPITGAKEDDEYA
tara:strand:+ start:246 stop:419 length:174 start_codon:yes stop_codon:yes gene_type:complete